jgi:putative transposase
MRLLDFCVMPNHWHLVVWPQHDSISPSICAGSPLTHTSRWHLAHGTTGTGPLYQGRFKSFPIQEDEHFFTVCRYVERNALRAKLVCRAEQWRWSSLWHRVTSSPSVTPEEWPIPSGQQWLNYVNGVETEAELKALRRSVHLCGREHVTFSPPIVRSIRLLLIPVTNPVTIRYCSSFICSFHDKRRSPT